ncbi:MAG: sigma-70 family RNA polymerase sigma factor [Planctomycetaceae bacterium]|nr:sigma-70 family RNA polymerase sigma factor [Planctomycetales bacterium]MCB9924651.1 sigma-70 family RNA polymerase sigma factor [Planctomycetaceae bacterium]
MISSIRSSSEFVGGRTKTTIRDALHFTNYCEQALRNKCITVLRRTIPQLAGPADDVPREVFEAHADETLDRMEWSEQLADAYSGLTHRERVVCWLVLGGHTWDEISERLNTSTDAARMMHRRAEQRVRSQMLSLGAK